MNRINYVVTGLIFGAGQIAFVECVSRIGARYGTSSDWYYVLFGSSAIAFGIVASIALPTILRWLDGDGDGRL